MTRPIHRLTNRRPEERLADCSVCGVDTPTRPKGGGRSHQCRNAHHRHRQAKTPAAARAYMAHIKLDPCAYCGAPSEHLDHITPKSLGGGEDWTNKTAACGSCNSAKGPTDLLRYLLYERTMTQIRPLAEYLASLGRGRVEPSMIAK